MTINDIPKFFEGRKIPARVIVLRQYNIVVFKVLPQNLPEIERVFGDLKPPVMQFLYKKQNFWDRFLIRYRNKGRQIRMELR